MLTLNNPKRIGSESIVVNALADTGSVYLIIPEHVRLQLALEVQSQKEVTLAEGGRKMVPYVGPIEVRFNLRNAVGSVRLVQTVGHLRPAKNSRCTRWVHLGFSRS
jgi:hypothetical protein